MDLLFPEMTAHGANAVGERFVAGVISWTPVGKRVSATTETRPTGHEDAIVFAGRLTEGGGNGIRKVWRSQTFFR